MKRMTAAAMAVLFVIMLFPLLPASGADALSDYSMIKVKLTTNNATSLLMSASGQYFINENGATFSGGTLTVRASGGTLTATHSELGLIYSGSSFSLMRAVIAPAGGYMRFNSRSYLGHFNIKVTSSGYIQVVNVVPLAHYLYGVVGYEMSNNFPLEALKAQAVTAKSYVLSQITASQNAEYYIGDTSSDQVYKGYSSANTNVIAAVDSTINEILTVNGQLLCTYYAASNGGETNLVTYAWPSRAATDAGYAITLDDYDFTNTMSTLETVDIPIGTSGQISKALYDFIILRATETLNTPVVSINAIHSVNLHTPKYAGTSRNMTRGTLIGDFATAYGVSTNVELSFLTSELYTYGVVTNMTLRTYWGQYSPDMTHYYIYHARWGHGVGMSQRGAQARANAGYGYRDILAFYYPGAAISNITVTTPTNPVNPGTGTAVTVTPSPLVAGGTSIPLSVIAYGTIANDGIALRVGPGLSYTSIGLLTYGMKVEIYETINDWHHITVNGIEGFVDKNAVIITSTPTAVPTLPVVTPTPQTGLPMVLGYGITNSSVNFRTGPGQTYQVIRPLEKGVAVTIYGLDSSGWYYVSVEGTLGYVSGGYVTVTTTQPSPTPTLALVTPTPTLSPLVGMPNPIAYAVTNDSVNFRTGAGVSYGLIRELKKGENVIIYSEDANGWSYVSAGNTAGYVASRYLTKTASVTPTPTPVPTATPRVVTTGMITTDGVNMRQSATTASGVMRQLQKNTGIYVLGQEGSWYKIEVSSVVGYVYADYITLTGTTTVAGTTGAPGTTGTPATVITTEGKGTTTGSVNMRKGSDKSFGKVTVLKKGTELTLYALENNWYKAKTSDGYEGYVSSKYVKVTVALPESAVTTTTGTTQLVTPSIIGLGELTSSGINFRETPSTSGKKITQLKKGTAVKIYALSGGWYEVEYQGTHGYISAKYVKMTAQLDSSAAASAATTTTTPTATPTPTTGGITTSGGVTTLSSGLGFTMAKSAGKLNLRSKPSKSGSVQTVMTAGSTFSIIGVCGEWYYVLYNGAAGFVYKAYCTIVSSGTAGVPTVDQSTAPYSTNTTAEVNMREGPGTSYSKIKLLANKSSIQVLLVSNGWCLIKSGSDFGYIIKDYVK